MSANQHPGGGPLRTKPLDTILRDAERPEYQLQRALGPFQLTLFGIGAIVGAGIFATIGTAAAGDLNRPGAGPALILSFVLTAVVCGFTALCYAEFASMVPISGSAYTYSYATLGELIAWIIGWDLIIEYAVGNVGVAISWAEYFKTLLNTLLAPLGRQVPTWISIDLRSAYNGPEILENAPHLFGRYPITINLLAVGIVAAITLILVRGVRESALFNSVMVMIKIVVLAFFVVVGLYWIQWGTFDLAGLSVRAPQNWTPFAPNGWVGISAGAALVFFAYIGFDAVSTVAEETRNPQRNLPIGIIASLIVCTVLYVLVAAVFSGLIPYEELRARRLANEQAEPLTMAMQYAIKDPRWSVWAVGIVAFGSVIAHTAVLLVFQLGQPRIFFSMARDGLLPPAFAHVHPTFRTPYFSTILTGVFVAAFAAFASIDEMVDLTNIGTLFAFILVCAGIIVLRIKDPDRPRPFRVPGGWPWAVGLYIGWVGFIWLFGLSWEIKAAILVPSAILFALCRNLIFPVLGIISCLYLIYFLPPTSWLRFAAWLNLGFVIYVGYGSNHSRLTGREQARDPAEHDRATAFTGAWLAWAGAALLFFMRGFDVWLAEFARLKEEAEKANQAVPLIDLARSALEKVRSLEPWLEVSWFLIVPLALNAFVLTHIVFWRAFRARRGGDRGRTFVTMALAVFLLGVCGYYFFLLAWHHLGPGAVAAEGARL